MSCRSLLAALLLVACGQSGGDANDATPSGGSAGSSAGTGSGGKASTGGRGGAGGSGDSGGSGSESGGAPGSEGGADSGGEGPSGSAGATAELVDCDPRKILCRIAPPQCDAMEVPSVDGTCYGPCVKIDRCACSSAAECPEEEQYTCWGMMHCGPYVK